MSADRVGGRLWRWLRTSLRSVVGVFDGGGMSAAVDEASLGAVRLQLTVWEQRL
jgi:hypothetical protein